MKKCLLLFVICFSASAIKLNAQELKEGYVTFPKSQNLCYYLKQWAADTPFTVDGKTNSEEWEDEEFFTSRVKPRTRVTQNTTNIYDFGDKMGRRSLWWVPIGTPATQALPNGKFDSEVFSMWSYLDHYGVWTSPFGWVGGAMSDIAHKNGVAVSGVASIPVNDNLSGSAPDWYDALFYLIFPSMNGGATDKLGSMLYYHGCDGLGYNSEFQDNKPYGENFELVPQIINVHNDLYTYMAEKNPIFENIWYDGTNDKGTKNFDSALDGKTGLYVSSSMFGNYNWNLYNRLSAGQTRAEGTYNEKIKEYEGGVKCVDGETKRGPWWQYAGMNQQGGEPKEGDETYTLLKDYKWSLGWWGAHSSNMFWESRNGGGIGEDNMLQHYMNLTETFFGNGPRNPAIKKEIKTVRAHRPSPDFHGVSAFIGERSAMTHQINLEPFYTFFNLGNGKFFNWKGERVSDKKWYSIGVQDYMPTWRFWFAPGWMQKDVTEGSTNLAASFTWEDAYFGGSCLKIEGTAAQEYLHLFKTAFKISNGQIITVRYKLLEGEADIRLVCTSVNAPGDEKAVWQNLNLCSVEESANIQDQSYSAGADGWVTKTFTIGGTWGTQSNLPGQMVGCVGLEFKNAKNMKLLLGEFSIMPARATTTPAAPQIKSSKVLANVFEGVDGKIIWTMDNDAARNAKTPKYNSDVNASMFKVYSQEEGGSETFVGVTTSWAAVVFQAPNTGDEKKIRFGVSAVSVDTRSESAISWGEWLTKDTYVPSDDVKLSKTTIKPNEGFNVSYVDSKHSSSTWTLKDSDGRTVKTGSGTSLSVPEGLSQQGGYDLIIDAGTAKERTLGYFVQITDEAVGALPEIHTLAVNGQDVKTLNAMTVKQTDEIELSYTGRSADGVSSRALSLNSKYVGTRSTEVGLSNGRQSFTIAGWFYFNSMPNASWNFMNVSDKTATWPNNTWGWAWNYGYPDGSVRCYFRGNADKSTPGELRYYFDNTRIQAKAWTHIAWTCDYNALGKFRCLLYINGVQQIPSKAYYDPSGKLNGDNENDQCVYLTTDAEKTGYVANWNGKVNVSANDYFYFGGAAYQGEAIDGYIDDFQIWNKALTASELKQSMNGLDKDNLPSAVVGFWDFENEAAADYSFSAYGSSAGAKAYSYDVVYSGGNVENGGGYQNLKPVFVNGFPFLKGTGYKIETKATWKDLADRRTEFKKQGASSRADGDEGASGSAKVTLSKVADHNIQLTLSNSYGSAVTGGDEESPVFPVFTVLDPSGIEGVDSDSNDVVASVEGRVIYFTFPAEGIYTLDAYNTSGMLVATETLSTVNGSVAEVSMGAPGVYLVKVVKDGKVFRTIKVSVK